MPENFLLTDEEVLSFIVRGYMTLELDLPEGLNEAISSLIQEMFTGSLGPVAIGFRLEELTVADGSLTLSGRIK